MASFALTGQDVIQINGRIITSLADADSFMVTFPNPLAKTKAAKNGNVIYGLDQTGLMGDLVLRLLIGSDDDKYLNSLMQTLISDISTFILMTANVVKRVGDGQGNTNSVVYQCAGGIFKDQVAVKTSAEGDVESSVSVYNMTYGNVVKTIQ
jgi:hypothetical protein